MDQEEFNNLLLKALQDKRVKAAIGEVARTELERYKRRNGLK